MQTEIEVRFLHIDHGDIRKKLEKLKAELKQPMRLMKRAIIDYPDRRNQKGGKEHWSWIRVRDEGNRTTVTYKQIAKAADLTTHEIEVEVSSYKKMIAILEAIGLETHSIQETKRETWTLNDCEVVLDEWPWLPPMVEIEGPSEAALRTTAKALSLDWQMCMRGNAVDAYRQIYPGIGKDEGIGNIPELNFDVMPEWLAVRQGKLGDQLQ